MIESINFPIGPQMSQIYAAMLAENPLASEEEIAKNFGANPKHPFFKDDVKLAKLIIKSQLEDDQGPEWNDTVSRQHWNVQVSIGIDVANRIFNEFGELSPEEIKNFGKIAKFCQSSGHNQDHFILASKITKILEEIKHIAGNKINNLEQVLSVCIESDPNFLSPTEEVDLSVIKKVISEELENESAISINCLVNTMLEGVSERNLKNE